MENMKFAVKWFVWGCGMQFPKSREFPTKRKADQFAASLEKEHGPSVDVEVIDLSTVFC